MARSKSPESQGLLDPKSQSTTSNLVSREQRNARHFIRTILWIVVPVIIFFSFFGGKMSFSFSRFVGQPCHGTQSPDIQTQPSDPPPPPYSACGTSFHNILDTSYPVTFSPSHDLSINQSQGNRRRGHWRRNPLVSGSAQVIRATTSDPQGKLDVKIVVNDQDIPVHTSWDAEAQSLRIRVDAVDVSDGAPPQRPCVDIRAVLHVPADAELRTLKIEVTGLDVALGENVGLAAAESVLTTVVGSLDVARNAIDSGDRIALTTVSGDIRASLPLLRTLESFSTSGTNDIDVYRRKGGRRGDEDLPKATLTVSTVSGNLRVHDPLGDAPHLPKTDYVRKISTVSGNIDAALLFGSHASISSVGGGRAETSLLPVLFDSLSRGEGGREDMVDSRLDSDVTSGNVRIQVLEPIWLGESHKKKWALRSRHGGVSGNAEIRLPDAWEGTFDVGTLTGRISVTGKDVQLRTRQRPEAAAFPAFAAFRSVRGFKGDGSSQLSAQSTTGSIEVVIGQE